MTRQGSVGLLHRLLRAVGSALKRGILGKSGHDYMKQFTGNDAYWDRVISAQVGWPLQRAPKSDPSRVGDPGELVLGSAVGAEDPRPGPPGPEEEPVHGWTRRQFHEYLARNPGYRSIYEAALRHCCHAATPLPQRAPHVHPL